MKHGAVLLKLMLVGAVSCAPSGTPETPARAEPEFSGEIVYKRLIASEETGGELAEVAPVRYFISGPRWKHCALDGSVIAEYFPDRNVVEFPGPLLRSVDAAVSGGPPRFEHLDETKWVLGRRCAGIRKTAPDETMVVFYDPNVFVEPSWYPNHHFGDWTELLSATKGALPLWWRSETNDVAMVFEATRLHAHSVPSELWGARCPPKREEPRPE
jgi:hypothetical protein